jgi:hypothetical protein
LSPTPTAELEDHGVDPSPTVQYDAFLSRVAHSRGKQQRAADQAEHDEQRSKEKRCST